MKTTTAVKTKSIGDLRIYQTSRKLEDSIYERVKTLPAEEFFALGDSLRRTSAAISHYITEVHKRYGYPVKLESLHLARHEAEALDSLLEIYATRKFGDTTELREMCTTIIKQAWGLIKYFKQRQAEQQAASIVRASDELVASRTNRPL